MTEPSGTPVWQTAADVWRHLIDQGGLRPNTYDSALAEDLRHRLGLHPGVDVEAGLQAGTTSPTVFILAFFASFLPFGQMVEDLIRMCERGGATKGKLQLNLEFDFGARRSLRFDPEKFKESLQLLDRMQSMYLGRAWDTNALWALISRFEPGGSLRDGPVAELIRPWITAYNALGANGPWPDFLPEPPPATGDPDLDFSLARVWLVWEEVVEESRRWGNRAFAADESILPGAHWSHQDLSILASDHWARQLAMLVHNAALVKDHELAAGLDAELAGGPQVTQLGWHIERNLLEFLSLPIWGQRHELFSAWISSEILTALDDQTVALYPHEGVLTFSFAGSQVATIESLAAKVHLWAELRSPLVRPVGKGRKKAIQPDYRLSVDPVDRPENTLVAVECKQYARPSAANFAAALEDYARGCPDGLAVLVNYGRVTTQTLERVAADVRGRTRAIGNVRPSGKGQIEFREVIREALVRRLGPLTPVVSNVPPAALTTVTRSGTITLKWGSRPKDLDLHVTIREPSGLEARIGYDNLGTLDRHPWAALERDVQTGIGPETVTVTSMLDAEYVIAVYNYSREAALAGSGAEVVIDTGTAKANLVCPEKGNGDWWHVARINGPTGAIDSSMSQVSPLAP